MSVIFTKGATVVTVTPIPGTLQLGDGNDDRGGGVIPNARAGSARNGSVQCLIDTVEPTEADVLSIRSGVGEGDVDVTGTDLDSDTYSYDALTDVTVTGDAVQVATISWKGTIST